MIGPAADGWRRKSSSKLSSKHWKKNKQYDNDLATSSSTTSTISSARGPYDVVVQKLSQDLHNFHVTNDEPTERGLKPMNSFTSNDSDVNACDLDEDEEKMNKDDFARAKKQDQMPHDGFDDIDDDVYIEALRLSCQKQKCSAVFKDDFARAEKQDDFVDDIDDDVYIEALLLSCQKQKCSAVFKTESSEMNGGEGFVLGGVMVNGNSSGLTAEQLKRIEENRHNAHEKRRLSKLMQQQQQQQQSSSLVPDTFNPIHNDSSIKSIMACQTERPHFSISDSNDFIDIDEIDEDFFAIEAPNADRDTFGQSIEAAKSSGMIDGGGALAYDMKAETEHATKEKTKKENKSRNTNHPFVSCNEGKGTPVPKRKETLKKTTKKARTSSNQCVLDQTLTQGDYFFKTKKAKTSNNQCVLDQARNKVSVVIEKRIFINRTELIQFQRGDVWVSNDGKFAYKLGYIHGYCMTECAVIDEIWMDLNNTYIGRFGTSVKESRGCDWVLLEKEALHTHMPPNERIKLNTLSYKLDHAQEPLITYNEDKTSVSYRLSTPNQTVPQHNSDRPIALDIFAGAGGASVGFEASGWNVKYKVEMNARCCETLRKNFKGKHIYQVDIANLLSELKSGSIDTAVIVWIHGSPPCQGFSMANTSGGIHDRQNKDCTLDFLEIVANIQPLFVSIENVPGFDSKRKLNEHDPENKAYLQTVIAKLLSLGYNVSKTIAMASNFGDPQDRKRVILFASKQGYMLPFLLQTHGGGVLPNVTVSEVLRDLEDIKPNCDGRIRINGKTVEGHFRKGTEFTNGKTPSNGDFKLKSKSTACTLTKRNKIVHYNNQRYLTMLELKRLMSFPDNHVICGNAKEIRDQIGNAVPCRFAEAIGKAVMNSYRIGRTITGNDSREDY